MVESSLSKDLIEAGATLVHKLDESGIRPDAAFWLYSPEEDTWKLVIVEIKVGKVGPRKVYRQIQEILNKLPKEKSLLSLDDITLAKPDAPTVQLLRRAIRTGPGVSGIRFRHDVIDGTLIDDAYVYRVN